MIISIEVSPLEATAIRELTAREFGQADESTSRLLIRRILLNYLDNEAVLDREELTRTVLASAPIRTVAPSAAQNAPEQAIAPKAAQHTTKAATAPPGPELLPPTRYRSGNETLIFRTWKHLVELCLNGESPRWYAIEIAKLQQDLRIKVQSITSLVIGLEHAGWIVRPQNDRKSVRFSEEAKTWLLKNQRFLYDEYGLFADPQVDNAVITK